MTHHKMQVKGMDIKTGTEFLATVSEDKNVALVNLLSYRQEVIKCPNESPLQLCLFLNPYDCLVASDNKGCLLFFAVYQYKDEASPFHTYLFSIDYKSFSITKKEDKIPVTAMGFYSKLNYLVLGDDFGNVQI